MNILTCHPHPSFALYSFQDMNKQTLRLPPNFQLLLPAVAPFACLNKCTPKEHVVHFLTKLLLKSAGSRFKQPCSSLLHKRLCQNMVMHHLKHLHWLSIIVSPHTFYFLIAILRSYCSHRLTNFIFDLALRNKLFMLIPKLENLPDCWRRKKHSK